MELRCPNCQHAMSAKGAKPGTYTPKCSKCGERFSLAISADEAVAPVVKKIAQPMAAATAIPAAASVSTNVTANVTAPPTAVMTAVPQQATTARQHATIAPAIATASPAPRVTHAPAAQGQHTAPAPHAAPTIQHAATDDADITGTLGGYQIERKLGQGGMGSVYLARQLSLDRYVAVKVLSEKLSQDAGFVARFTREAYAAAQLTHHNVVQIYDIGEDRGRHFYSMEFVEGSTLAGMVEKDGKIDPEVAVGYALQAARGLKFAHDQGLVHRDVKPDNLMVNDQGIVKVADLGLVKKRGLSEIKHASSVGGHHSKLETAQSANTTGFDMSMGTPAYMAPEQARDAASVDGRADIYSLGCTLYDLLTGHPPFTGKTVMEVLNKHASEPVTPPDMVSKRVPKELSALLMKMVAKKPQDRYHTIGDNIRAMEDFLGAGSSGPFTPKEEHAAAMEVAAKAFNNTPLARARQYAVPAFFAICLILALGAAMVGETMASRILWAGTYVGVAALTVVSYIVIAGITRRHVVFVKARQFIFGARIVDWLKTLAVLSVIGLVLYLFNLLIAWAIVALVAGGIAAAFHFGLEMLRDKQRQIQVTQIEGMLRKMRLRGLDEDSLRQFACRYAGHRWEEFYEALFGYDAKLEARQRWGVGLRGKARPKFGAWRDIVIKVLDGRIESRKTAREQRLLARLEEKRLKAEGLNVAQARKKAKRQADQMVARAAKVRESSVAHSRQDATAGPTSAVRMTLAPVAGGSLLDSIHTEDESTERVHESWMQRRHGGLMGFLFGSHVRLPIAILLLATFFLWFHKINPDFPQNIGQAVEQGINDAHDNLTGENVRNALIGVKTTTAAPVVKKPVHRGVELFFIPRSIQPRLNGYAIGAAGLLLLISCVFGGWRIGFAAIAGAVLLLAAGQFFPTA